MSHDRGEDPDPFDDYRSEADPMVRLFGTYGRADIHLFVLGVVASVFALGVALVPPLVLDEATSAVDTETELYIQRALERFTADQTTFVIAHRLSTVRDADRILVLEAGRITERGTHEELLAQEGLYATLWRVQSGDVHGLDDRAIARLVGDGDRTEN